MVAGSILPVAWHNGQLYFLFGKENPLETSAKGFSDFGGGVEGNETPYQTALREGGEELTGFLGDGVLLEKVIRKRGGVYKITVGTYHIHIFCAEYDPNLPRYYNANHRFLWDRMDHQLLKKTCLFEKIEIAWMTPADMRKRIKEFRPFYQDMVRQMLAEMPDIQGFIQKNQERLDKTPRIGNDRASMNHNRTRRR
jgi:8-oxo-dGTP pyrophosphatase MutT (NUDIX family)